MKILPRVLLSPLNLALALSACNSGPTEVQLLQTAQSPDGIYSGTVEEHIYGPHFGGEAPAVEVHVRHVESPQEDGGLVFQAPEEGSNVSVTWLGPERLQITHSAGLPVSSMRSAFETVKIDLREWQG